MAELELSLLGPPVVRYRGEELALVARKPIALLLYLAARPARPHSRGHLATLLWEEYGEAEARNNLSTALSRLRQLARFPIGSVGDSLVWRPSAEVTTDLAAFERLA